MKIFYYSIFMSTLLFSYLSLKDGDSVSVIIYLLVGIFSILVLFFTNSKQGGRVRCK
jgi:uncharacterized membrane protein